MLEQMYSDFTTKLLPKIGEGLSMTKDYFFELFGRYVKYLIIVDSIWLVVWTVLFIWSLVYLKRKFASIWVNFKETIDDHPGWFFPLAFIIALPIVTGLCAISYAELLTKDIFVPEFRVIEEVSELVNSPAKSE